MGIRFRCHHCEHELNVKDYLGGKRGKCPKCEGSFRIPPGDSDRSLPVEAAKQPPSLADVSGASPPVASLESETGGAEATDNSELQRAGQQPPLAGESQTSTSPEPAAGGLQVETQDQVASQTTLTPPPPPGAEAAFLPAALAEAKEAAWYVRIADGSQFGPAPAEVFVQWLDENRVQPDSLVWRDGWEQWKPAADALSDYFERESREINDKPKLAADTSTSSSLSAGGAQPIPVSGDMPRIEKRRRRKRNYQMTIAFLSLAAILLIVTLVIVLVVQQQ